MKNIFKALLVVLTLLLVGCTVADDENKNTYTFKTEINTQNITANYPVKVKFATSDNSTSGTIKANSNKTFTIEGYISFTSDLDVYADMSEGDVYYCWSGTSYPTCVFKIKGKDLASTGPKDARWIKARDLSAKK